jgi:hypothetical protein
MAGMGARTSLSVSAWATVFSLGSSGVLLWQTTPC